MLDLDRRVAPAVEDLARVDSLDLAHRACERQGVVVAVLELPVLDFGSLYCLQFAHDVAAAAVRFAPATSF